MDERKFENNQRHRRSDKYQTNQSMPEIKPPVLGENVKVIKPRKPKKDSNKKLAKRIGALVLSAGIGLGILDAVNNKNDEEINNNPSTPKIEENNKKEAFRESLVYQVSPNTTIKEVPQSDTPVLVVQENSNNLELISQKVLKQLPLKDNSVILVTYEREFFDKYSNKFNTNLEEADSGSFTSIEEMIDAYQNDPERFSKYAKPFMKSVSLDFMKIKLASIYGCDPEQIMITYDVFGEDSKNNVTNVTYQNRAGSGDVFEVRVRVNKNGYTKTIENPSFEIKSLTDSKTQIDEIISATRYSKIDKNYWRNFLAIWEMESYRPSQHDIKEYNDESLQLFLETLGPITTELGENANRHLTWEEEER